MRQLARRNISPEEAGLGALGHQVSEHTTEPLLRSNDLLVSMQECRELGVVVSLGLMDDERIGLQHCFESLASIASLVSDLVEIFEVGSDVTLVPGRQDRIDIGEVLVKGGASDSGLRGDLRHGHRGQPVLGYQVCGGVKDGVTHRATVRLDRLAPQLRHPANIQETIETL